MGWLWSLIVGGVIGWLAGVILGRDIPGGVIGNIVAGFLGSWIGNNLLSGFGPEMGGFFIIPSLIGAIILILIVSFVLKRRA
ncbi:GlsB/YeaQ/YmgE family stress response membrane protein [Eremococcus coleocola]|uniref:Transglycosylase associated protein n=1 Tax=Eremococcus coleocola ACS-139-V-Col8 TaxID=908337 RepID=E4KPH0_9LACT|nr:GlsB/YeaQ/YmgE family stress response membrane protein [Eremococcus coleocola]EFR31180.1 transglycosylase associated protein [Eremococcus coleocola ACS-139-V-Col8]